MNKWLVTAALAAVAFGWYRNAESSDGPPTQRIESGELVTTIVSDGSNVDLQDHVEEGVWTLFEYTADW